MKLDAVKSRLLAAAVAFAGQQAASPGAALAEDPHAHHRHMAAAAKNSSRSVAEHKLPQVNLVRDDGKSIALSDELNDGRPVVLTFIFTTCTTICPIMSQVFAQLQEKLGSARDKVHMVSISIDPEQDTPARLTEYAKKFHAGPQWHLYTGTVEASVATQRAFDAYRGDKMDHNPVTFVRGAAGGPWVRFDGFASADELVAELRALHAIK